MEYSYTVSEKCTGCGCHIGIICKNSDEFVWRSKNRPEVIYCRECGQKKIKENPLGLKKKNPRCAQCGKDLDETIYKDKKNLCNECAKEWY